MQQRYEQNEIFMANEGIPHDSFKANKHVLDYVVTDSSIERTFAELLDGAKEVLVYAKLPDRFQIPTPFGGYNPDWAIAFEQNAVKHLYFVAETKGSSQESSLRVSEKNKIDSAKKFFATLNSQWQTDIEKVHYGVVNGFDELYRLISH